MPKELCYGFMDVPIVLVVCVSMIYLHVYIDE